MTDQVFAVAARVLATLVKASDLELGRIFPALSRIREIPLEIAAAVASVAWQRGLTDRPRPPEIRADAASWTCQPIYPSSAAGAA